MKSILAFFRRRFPTSVTTSAEARIKVATPELPEGRPAQLRELETRIGYTFREAALLDRSLTHSSFSHRLGRPEQTEEWQDYEALEFLGDSILGFVVSEVLFRTYPARSEGELSRIKSFLVSTEQLFVLSQQLGLGRFMRLSYGEEKTGGRAKKAILADLFESVTAAIYLDGGLEAARRFILSQFDSRLQQIAQKALDCKDFKSALQEQLHLLGLAEPRYRVVDELGPDHSKKFVVEVRVGDRSLAQAVGKSKKEAQQKAAEIAIRALGEDLGSVRK